ncbi:MAG: intermembrane transport protein PqiB, partial [Thiolinea sp.]
MTQSVSKRDLPTVAVRRQRWPSPVWLIPLAAAVVGFWLLVQYWQQRGDVITVRFPSAEGIQAGSTEVRYKAVAVGKVKQVTLDEELNPLVTLQLSKAISDALDCSAQFWVVRPRIRGAEISGISTLFSGTYVGMIPEQPEDAEDNSDSLLCYEVLDEAPRARPERPGREFRLVTDSMGSLDVGTPLFFKQLQVGEIINYTLSADTGKIEIGVFIDQPYYRFVNVNTRFWNASGAEFKMNSVGAEFRMESLTSLLAGGVAFDSPKGEFVKNLPVSAEGTVFELYADYDSSQEKRYTDRLYYTLYFNGSLRGLSEEAPVEFQGIRVGKVEKIKMHLDPETLDVRIPVLISIEPQRFSENIDLQQAPAFMHDMVDRGMRAKLQSGNLLTGKMYVALAIDEDAPPDKINESQFYAVFPTSPTPVEELSKLARGIADDVKVTLASISRFMESKQLDKTVTNLNKLLQETEVTVVEAREALSSAAAMMTQLEKDIPQLAKNANNVLAQLDQETLPVLTENVDRVGNDVSRVMQQVDEQTLPTVTRNLNKVTADVGKVMERVDQQTLPTLARNLNQVSADVGKVMKRVDEQTLPSIARNLNQIGTEGGKVLKQLDTKTLPATNKLANTAADSVVRVTGTVNRASMDFARSSVQLNKTMMRLQNTLTHLDRMLARNSPTQ